MRSHRAFSTDGRDSQISPLVTTFVERAGDGSASPWDLIRERVFALQRDASMGTADDILIKCARLRNIVTVEEQKGLSSDCCYPAQMEIDKILTELRQEHAQLTEAIMSLERMAAGQGKRRGRPPAWMVAASQESAPKLRGRPPGSKSAPKKQAEIATDIYE
jgi:hypothetical protein